MKASLTRLRDKLDTAVWLIPGFCLVAAVALSMATEAVDSQISKDATAWYLFRGGPEGARSILSTVAAALMTLTGVVFSVTILVLQLASNQFSPRVLRTFLQDRGAQVVLGIFVGTFLYALLGLRSVRGATAGVNDHIPALTVWLCVVLAAVCIASFVYFLHHVAQSIRAVNVLARIGDHARGRLQHLFPEGLGHDPEETAPVLPEGGPSLVVPLQGTSGVVIAVDEERLWTCACEAKVTVGMVPMVGDFVAYGAPLFEVWGDASALDVESLVAAVTVGRERNVRQDIGFALRELVDIAERALSPGINDPTTAVQALDQLHDLLRRLVRRRFPSPYRLDEDEVLRLILPRPDWDAHVRLAADEIRHYGQGSVQVARRLRFLLEDLLTVAPPSRRRELLRQLAMLEESVGRGFEDADDKALANTASAQGHGPH